MEAEDESVKPTENNCDWCGKVCRSEKYCCNKCKHDHAKADKSILTVVKPAVEWIWNGIRLTAAICLHLLYLGLTSGFGFALHFWLTRVSEPYLLISEIVPDISQRFLPQNVSNIVNLMMQTVLLYALYLSNKYAYWFVSMLIVCLLSTAIYYWFGIFTFVANCVVLLIGAGCFIFLNLVSPTHKRNL